MPNSKTRRGRVGKGVAQTLDTGMQQHTLVPTGAAFRGRDGERNLELRKDELANTVPSVHGGDRPILADSGYRIRRLTPTECERLQAFPDGHTALYHDGKPVSDTQRYKMMGNAVTTSVVAAVIKRLYDL